MWKVWYKEMPLQHVSFKSSTNINGVKHSKVVQAIQGKLNDGQWLPRLSRPVHNTNVWPHGLGEAMSTKEEAEGFQAVNGKGSGWFVTFMGIPDDHQDAAWDVEGTQLGLPSPAKVTGYQLRVDSSHVDTARFLFRSFSPPGAHP